MRARRMIAAAACAAALAVGSVTATLAYFTDAESAQNTFVVGRLFTDPANDFTLWEHEAEDADGDGCYELTEEMVQENTYAILPGVNIPKDPTVKIANLEADAYLYIKVTSSLPASLSYAIDSENWTELNRSGDTWVYTYKGVFAEGNVIKATDGAKKSLEVNILANKEVVVADTHDPSASTGTLDFEAYMVQAIGNGADAKEAWANTYGSAQSS